MSIAGIRPPWWATLGIGLVATSVITAWMRAQQVRATGKNIEPSDVAKGTFFVGVALVALYVVKRLRG